MEATEERHSTDERLNRALNLLEDVETDLAVVEKALRQSDQQDEADFLQGIWHRIAAQRGELDPHM